MARLPVQAADPARVGNKNRLLSNLLQSARIDLGHGEIVEAAGKVNSPPYQGRYDHINRRALPEYTFDLQLPVDLLRALTHARQSPVGS